MIWLGDLPVGLIANSNNTPRLHYIEPDALGSPRVVIDSQRDMTVWRWDLSGEAFGKTGPDENPDGDSASFQFDMRFPGQRYDSATGLNYNYFRDYEAATGRYAQSDPIGLAGGISTYGYAGGNPILWVDSKGLEVELNLFNRYEGSPYLRVADSFVSPRGVYAVGSHGDRLHVYDQNARPFSPMELADIILKDEKFKGKREVLLFGCETGRDSLSFAQQLADILQVPVVAPNAYVFYPPKGRIFLGEKGEDNKPVPGTRGEWVTFCPGGCPWLWDTITSWFD